MFDAGAPMRQQAGLTNSRVYRATGNANMVTILSEAPNEEVVHNLISNAILKDDMQKAGVVSAPQVQILSSAN